MSKTYKFEFPYEITGYIYKSVKNYENTISVCGRYEIIKSILERLIIYGVPIADEIELENYDVRFYNREFILSCNKNGLNVEKLYVDGNYLDFESDIIFIHNDCNEELLNYVNNLYSNKSTNADKKYCNCKSKKSKECKCSHNTKENKCDVEFDLILIDYVNKLIFNFLKTKLD